MDEGKNEFYKDVFIMDCVKKYDEIYCEVLLDVDNMVVVNVFVYYLIGFVKNVDIKKLIEGVRVFVFYVGGNDIGFFSMGKDGCYEFVKFLNNYGDKFMLVVKIEKEGFVMKLYEIFIELDMV